MNKINNQGSTSYRAWPVFLLAFTGIPLADDDDDDRRRCDPAGLWFGLPQGSDSYKVVSIIPLDEGNKKYILVAEDKDPGVTPFRGEMVRIKKNLYKVWGMSYSFLVLGDYLKPNDAAIFIRQFKENLALHRMAAIITLPIRKPNEKLRIQPGDVYQMKGATEYADSATSVLLLEKKSHGRSNDEVTLHFAKHRIASKELKPIALKFRRKKCIFMAQDE